ncbi:sulfotransferase family protein [Nocardioides salsibiostraticola]
MALLSVSERDPSMRTVQCDLCGLPLIITNTEPVIARQGWRLTSRGASYDACPQCQEERSSRAPLERRREGWEPPVTGGRLPNLLLIGAAKAGTTSMHAYLDEHPDIFMATWKELRFFTDPDHLSWLETYRQQFASPATIVGESSTMYTRSPALPGVAGRAADLVPDAKLIYLVRDPVARAIASYTEERFHGLEPRSIDDAFADLDDPYNPYVAASRYAEQLEPYLLRFPRDQILLLSLKDLGDQPARTMSQVFTFLGVDPEPVVDVDARHNDLSTKVEYSGWAARARRGAPGRALRRLPPGLRDRLSGPVRRRLASPMERPTLSPELEGRLREVLAPDAQRFRELSGLELADWSV